VLAQQGKLDEAEGLQRKAVALAEEHMSESELAARGFKVNLARTLMQRGELQEAEALLQWVYDNRCRLLGETHQETLMTLCLLASLKIKAGQYDSGIASFKKALTSYGETLGDDHPETLRVKSNLASVLIRHKGALDEAEALLARPFAIVNVWRPLRPVRTYPLALCDARTVADEDLVAAERRAKDRIGELFMVRYESGQRWYYFPDMTESEVLLIKTFDSREDGRARWCVHTALVSTAFPEDAPPRESIETRVFAFF